MESTMLLRKRRVMEDWNLEIGENSRDAKPNFRERLAASGKLWAICALAIAAFCAVLAISAFRIDSKAKEQTPPRQIGRQVGTYDDYQHAQFMDALVAQEKKRGVNIKARYVADDEIHITVPPDVSSDEMSFIVRFAGVGTMNRFGATPNIMVFSSTKPGEPLDKLVAEYEWNKGDNAFVVKSKKA